ncbi:MAG: O-methyltransferase [Prolixibacteraceae bacterium]|nr:O-methyltransferase [Prolixibacteraceae bacterium]
MDFNRFINQYISEHTGPEEDFLKALDRETNLKCVHPRMLSGHIQGKVLYMLCKMIRPESILELGTYTGYSAISLGLALEGNAVIHTIEQQDELSEITSQYIEKAGLKNKISCHYGNIFDIVPSLNSTFDLVFFDADKREYPAYYNLVFDKLKPGGYIIADNILWDGKVIDPDEQNDPQTRGIIEFNNMVNADPRVENVLFPMLDGMMVIRKNR